HERPPVDVALPAKIQLGILREHLHFRLRHPDRKDAVAAAKIVVLRRHDIITKDLVFRQLVQQAQNSIAAVILEIADEVLGLPARADQHDLLFLPDRHAVTIAEASACREQVPACPAGGQTLAAMLFHKSLRARSGHRGGVTALRVGGVDQKVIQSAAGAGGQSAAPSPPSRDALFRQAVDHHRAGRLGLAEQLYRRLLVLHPGDADALDFLGLVAHARGRPDEALRLIGEAIRRNPRKAGYHSDLGVVQQSQGQLQAAVASYRRAIALDPELVNAHYNL